MGCCKKAAGVAAVAGAAAVVKKAIDQTNGKVGDVNGDGVVNAKDYVCVAKNAVEGVVDDIKEAAPVVKEKAEQIIDKVKEEAPVVKEKVCNATSKAKEAIDNLKK